MPQSLLQNEYAVPAQGLSEAAVARIRRLTLAINELEAKKANDEGLSTHNENHLKKMKKQRELEELKDLTGLDPLLAIVPQGAFVPAAHRVPKLVECTPIVAAEILVFAPIRQQAARLANDQERKDFEEHCEAQRRFYRGQHARSSQDIARATIESLIGGNLPAGSTIPAQEQPTPPAPPQVGVTEAEVPEIPAGVSPGTAPQATPDDGGPASDTPPGDAPTPEMEGVPTLGDLGTRVANALQAGGLTTLEEVAQADPAKLAEMKGISAAKAPEIIVQANELLAEARDAAESESESTEGE